MKRIPFERCLRPTFEAGRGRDFDFSGEAVVGPVPELELVGACLACLLPTASCVCKRGPSLANALKEAA